MNPKFSLALFVSECEGSILLCNDIHCCVVYVSISSLLRGSNNRYESHYSSGVDRNELR